MTRFMPFLTLLVLALSATAASAQSPHRPEVLTHESQFAAVPATLTPPALPPTLTMQALAMAATLPAAQTPQPAASVRRATGSRSKGALFLAGLLGSTVGMVAGGLVALGTCTKSTTDGSCLPLPYSALALPVGAGVGAALGVRLAQQ
jgi:hypothetical protein